MQDSDECSKSKPKENHRGNQYSWKMRLFLTFAPFLLSVIVKIYYRTCRVTCIGKENEDQYLRRGKPILFVSWHQGLLYYIYHFRNRNGIIMVSQSKDGELIARLLKRLGFQSARGSSSREGKRAMRSMIDIINNTQCSGGLVADAPRGPFGVAKMGIIKIAKETGLPLIPVMFWGNKKILLNNWDKTILLMPFSKVNFYYADPIFVSPNATDEEMEKIRAGLSEQLNRMHQQARECFH